MAKLEKKLKRENGDTIIISMDIWVYSMSKTMFSTSVSLVQKGKRKPLWNTSLCDFGESQMGWKYRSMSLEERDEAVKKFVLQYVTIDELRQVRDELLESIRTDNFKF